MKMMAARLYGKMDLRVEEAPVPDIADGELLLRVKAAAICGTDLRMYINGAAGVDEAHPLICAHEFSGVIEEVGAGAGAGAGAGTCAGESAGTGVDAGAGTGTGAGENTGTGASVGTGFTKGMRVSVAPNIGCGVCDRCAAGKSHHCLDLRALGVNIDGGFAEFVKIPAEAVRLGNVVKLDPGVSFEAAAANEALSCVYNAYERYGVEPGDTVVIIGAGAIGLMHAKLAKLSGAAKIIMSDLSADRLSLCTKIEPSLIAVGGDLKQAVDDETSGRGAEVVITACSSASAQRDAFGYAALDGRVNFFGGLPSGAEVVALNTNIIHYKQLHVTGTTRSSHAHYRKTMRMIKEGLFDLDGLITHRFALDKIDEAFDNTHKTIGLKQAIMF
ncbi:MAG: alcohol dehydrogenase catalytic domain-containing protein [Oscillospiraceae bacterium]|nr:alcohol dehydrogenase catalytic domain-containing protein [Oscillospiraceae bacterium]